MIHELKTCNEYYEEVFMGHKTFEVRKNDRDFQKGDTLILKEWDNFRQTFTGRKLSINVTYVFKGGKFGLEEGFVVMAIAKDTNNICVTVLSPFINLIKTK